MTPKGQIDYKLGIVICPKCNQENFKGAQLCGHGDCDGHLPATSTTFGESTANLGNIDLSRFSGTDIEHVATMDRVKVKRAWAEQRMDRLADSLRRADSPEKLAKYSRLRNQTINIYNRYAGTHYST